MYDDYNLTSFRNKNQGLSLENFISFIEGNYILFQSYHIKSNQYIFILFN